MKTIELVILPSLKLFYFSMGHVAEDFIDHTDKWDISIKNLQLKLIEALGTFII